GLESELGVRLLEIRGLLGILDRVGPARGDWTGHAAASPFGSKGSRTGSKKEARGRLGVLTGASLDRRQGSGPGGDGGEDGREEAEAVGARAAQRVHGVLGVRHQADDVPPLVADP